MSEKYNHNDPDPSKFFQSKIEKVFLELHNFSFSHSSSSNSRTEFFLGRKQLKERLVGLLSDTVSKTGVYLITGARGVGKSSLMSQVQKETSVNFSWGRFNNILVLFVVVFLMQLINTLCHTMNFSKTSNLIQIGLLLLDVFLFILLGHNSIFKRRGFVKENKGEKKYTLDFEKEGFFHSLFRVISASVKELTILDSFKPANRSQFFLKNLIIILTIQLLHWFLPSFFSYLQWMTNYLLFFFIVSYWRFTDTSLLEMWKWERVKDKKRGQSIDLKFDYVRKFLLYLAWGIFFSFVGFAIFAFIYFGMYNQLGLYEVLRYELYGFLIIYIGLIGLKFILVPPSKKLIYLRKITFDEFLNSITKYIKNHKRIYLKINFGHELLKERDVLRLIARTIETEYIKFTKSFQRMFLWRLCALTIILLLTVLFHETIYERISDSLSSEGPRNYLIDYLEIWFKKPILVAKETINCIYEYSWAIPSFFWSGEYGGTSSHSIDYSYCLIFVLIYLTGCLILKSNLFSFVTHRKIIQQLEDLNNSIVSEKSNEKSSSVGGSFWSNSIDFGLSSSTRNVRKIADEREIEKEILRILNDIQQIPYFFVRPEFVIIFDELDKVDPERGGNKEDFEAKDFRTKNSLFSLDAVRDRQSTILKLLTNLKFFLTTAKVKFFFIAGREMYDIYLADTSDRNNYIGSIFHDVVNVPSFLSDHSDDDCIDLTALTEEFVCRYLIPESYPVLNYNLHSYKNYINEVFFFKSKDSLKNQKTDKIIALLQQFIIYLSSLSKGAPKKLGQLFESFIERCDRQDIEHRFCIKRYRNTRNFLTFDYHDQYAVGMIANLINPIFLKLKSSSTQKHGDKLLVSSLFFIDHVYKFYSQSFSWKNLDASPEILDINKAPELRSSASELVNFLSQIHIEKSTSGLFDFGFENLISHEISFLSKIYEEFSAIYNFSLDESLAIKQYYKKILFDEQQKYEKLDIKHADFIYSLSALNIIVGDLYFYDDELEEAIIYYKNGVQALRQVDTPLNMNQLLLLVRNMLKLGFAYEKRKMYDFTFLTYGELSRLLIETRDMDVSSLGLSIRKKTSVPEKESLVFVKASKEELEGKKDKIDNTYFRFVEVPTLGCYELTVDENIANAQPLSFGQTSAKTQRLLLKNSTFEGLRILYQPILAKFQILEKSHFGGITKNNLDQLMKEFEFLVKTVDVSERKLLVGDFYAKVGEILYYKNYHFQNFPEYTNSKNNKNNLPCSACRFYSCSAESLLFDSLKYPEESMKSTMSLNVIMVKALSIASENPNLLECTLLARLFSDWGDVFFSCDGKFDNFCDKKECSPFFELWGNSSEPNYVLLKKWKTFFIDGEKEKYIHFQQYLTDSTAEWTKFDVSLLMYSLSSIFYKRANLHKQSAYQINKVLQLFRSYLYHPQSKSNSLQGYMKREPLWSSDLVSKLAQKAIRSIYLAYDDLTLFDLNKRKKDMNDSEHAYDPVQLNMLVLDREIDRLKIVVEEIRLKITQVRVAKLKECYSKYITSPYEMNDSISARIYRLRLKVYLNWKIMCYIMESDIPYLLDSQKLRHGLIKAINDPKMNAYCYWIFDEPMTNQDIVEKTISESLFCLKEILRLSKTSGESYFFNHNFMASTHKKMGDWFILYEIYLKLIREPLNDLIKRSKIEEYIKDLFDEGFDEQLSSYYEYNQALSHYYKCKEAHSGGRAYFDLIDNLYYLRDDYDDRSYHFNIAIERYLINSKVIDENINTLKNKYRDSTLHEVNNYFYVV